MASKERVAMSKREFVHTVLSSAVAKIFILAGIDPAKIPTRERVMIEKRTEQLSYAVTSQLQHLPRIIS